MSHRTTNTPASEPDRRTFLKSTAIALSATAAASWKTAAADDPKPQGSSSEPYQYERDPLLVTQNPTIIRGRDAALEILKPTPAQLQRGLELHRQSLVFDSYGFAPRAAIDGTALAQADADGASDFELINLRSEMSMTRPALDPKERNEFDTAMKTAGVTCIFQNAGEEGNDPLLLLRRLAHFTYLGDMLRGTLTRATLPEDIEAAHAAGQHCLYLTGNGIPLPYQHTNVSEDLDFVRLFFQLGIRMMHLTYNRRNRFGDGCAETANGGISDFGRAAIAEMNKVGVIVDVAHSGWQTSLEAAKASSKPMVASHTTCTSLQEHIRSKPDNVIQAICDTGGLVGICCIPYFLGGSGGIDQLITHIDYVAQKYGVDHVAIGTDISYTSQFSSAENSKVKSRGKRLPRFASLWPPGALGGNWPGAKSLAWTNWPLFTVGLVQKGYSDEDIQKILGGNILRICRDVLPTS
ncbi:MAG TPA: membrane dipeptidase [Planctomicrobium sp.]|nr:membrane dipeptidase [Planctomicrobium sp.]